jgi:hypothetical protein
MKPIPISLLIHSAVLKKPTGTDEYQNKTYEETELSFIRIEPETQTRKTKDNTEGAFSATLFFDCVNSRPANICFELGDRITACWGTEYEVRTVERLFDNRGLHHIELGLM